MSDIKRSTLLSAMFERASAWCYACALHKFKGRLSDTKEGSEERFHEAQNITANLGFIDRCVCRLGSLFMRLDFFFMANVDDEEYLAMLIKERFEDENKNED